MTNVLPFPTDRKSRARGAARGAKKPHSPDRGVWESDAPDGYLALVVTTAAGRQLLRVEIAADAYSVDWVERLDRWLNEHDVPLLSGR